MIYVALLFAGYLLGIFTCAIFAAVYLLHRPRYVAPTKHCRMNRGEPRTSKEPPPMPECKVARDDGVRYEWINLTGEER